MTRINNVDHVLMLLQQQLQKLNSTERKARSRKAGKVDDNQAKSSLRRVAALHSREGLSEENFDRALIRALLVDQLGEALAEDHRFDRVASEVYRIISEDADTLKLLREAAQEARDSA